jgi:hypothetical protein
LQHCLWERRPRRDHWRQSKSLSFYVAILLLVIATSAPADVYKWTDETGNVHYGDHPPEQVPYERVETDNPPPSGASGGLRPGEQHLLQDIQKEEQRADRERKAQAREEARNRQRQAEEAARRRDQCDSYRRRLKRIEQRLVSGYSAHQSALLHDQQDEYTAKIKQYCD